MAIERFDITAAANDSGRDQQDTWTLLIDPAGGSVHVEHNRQRRLRIVTFAELLRSEMTARIAANDP